MEIFLAEAKKSSGDDRAVWRLRVINVRKRRSDSVEKNEGKRDVIGLCAPSIIAYFVTVIRASTRSTKIRKKG